MTRPTRRQFVLVALGAPVGALWRPLRAQAQGLDAFMAPSVPCKDDKITPAAADVATFRRGSPERKSLVEPGSRAQSLVLTGSVRGVVCGPISGAVLDFWHADGEGVYDATGFRFRGHQATDRNGRYRLETVVPGPAKGRAPHLSVRVQVPGKKVLTTQLFFPNEPRNASDPRFREGLLMTVKRGSDVSAPLSAIFDFVLDA